MSKSIKKEQKMARSEIITKRKVANAIDGSCGIIQRVVDKIGCNYVTIWRKLNKHPELRAMLELEKEKVLDMAENALLTKIKDLDTTSILFFLKTQGKKRGYIERQEQHIEINKVPDLNFNIKGKE